jgi:hypothetical protein
MKADDSLIKMPESVTKFTCLDSFFNGVGLDMLSNGLSAQSIARSAMGKICSQLSSAWDSLQGAVECGLTLTGPDTNFDLGLGSGTVCPTVNFGGGGDTLISAMRPRLSAFRGVTEHATTVFPIRAGFDPRRWFVSEPDGRAPSSAGFRI